ncbi:uncharacterized protein LOC125661343 isoform X2 [Ostrea edulis]|uniref:uncharacterized protein LOC125661343 isoform X2 n=1 Tax=Ostrea edulis TaxID=37623 RepID=UPI0024AFB01C|nr:uncharacterized protein LOC125661343 isoform X2 [Ostrea edulis]
MDDDQRVEREHYDGDCSDSSDSASAKCTLSDEEQLPYSSSSVTTSSESESYSTTRGKRLTKRRVRCGSTANQEKGKDASSSESDSEQWEKPKDMLFPSNFDIEDIAELMVFYDKEPTPMDSFLKQIKEIKHFQVPVAVLANFKKMTQELLGDFHLDLEMITQAAKEISDTKDQERMSEIRQLGSTVFGTITTKAGLVNRHMNTMLGNDVQNMDMYMFRLYSEWHAGVIEFLRRCIDFVHSILYPQTCPTLSSNEDNISPDQDNLSPDQNNSSPDQDTSSPDQEKLTSERFCHNLFMSFSRICLLQPRSQRRPCGIFRKKIVVSEPDISFVQTMTLTRIPVLVMVCEVERDEPCSYKTKHKETWIEQIFNSRVLGQIGMELLSASKISFFTPRVVGIARLRTEIMFFVLDITKEHLDAIQRNEALEGKRSSIHYTKTYNILTPGDRSEVQDILYYMAAIQNFNFFLPL